MPFTVQPRWKEEIVVTSDTGLQFILGCGWGVEPPVAYVPSEQDWNRCTPGWLWDYRAALIEAIRGTGHVVKEGAYSPLGP